MAFIDIDPSGPEPVFRQIVQSVKRAIATGQLRPDDRLPSVRELAGELVINPNTIAKAYRALESEGVTYSRRGAGTFVSHRNVVIRLDERRRRLKEALESTLADAVHLGLTREEVERVFDAAMKRFKFGEEP